MALHDIIGLIADVVTILALLIGAGLAVFVLLQFAPILKLRLNPSWIDANSHWLVLKMEVENVSRVRIRKHYIHLQVLQYEYPTTDAFLSEWVPFKQDKILQEEPPVDWHEPEEVFATTKQIDPSELLSVERLYYCPPNTILKVGLQAKITFGLTGRIAAKVRSWDHQWTTTAIVAKDQRVPPA